MDTAWYELQISGIEVEEKEISLEEFDRLFDFDGAPSTTVD